MLLFVLLGSSCIAVGATTAQEANTGQQTWLFPIPRPWGPSNQKSDLRAIMALAKHLNCGYVLTGVWQHYLDTEHLLELQHVAYNKEGQLEVARRPDAGQAVQRHIASAPQAPASIAERKGPAKEGSSRTEACFPSNYMPYEDILDPEAVRKWVPAATVRELKAQGWDGELDALVYHSWAWEALQTRWQHAALPENVTLAPTTKYIARPGPLLGCDGRKVQELAKQVRPYRVVGVHMVMLGWHDWLLAPRLHTLPPSASQPPPSNACLRDVQTADRMMLRPSSWVVSLAERFIARRLRGLPYLAVHARPYPDACLDAWRHLNMTVFGSQQMPTWLQDCRAGLGDLHLKLGRCVKKQLQRYNLTQTFIMVHPAVRHVALAALMQAGLNETSVVFMDGHELEAEAGCHDSSATFLSLVEEHVAVHADVFLGTAVSTMTQIVAMERMGRQRHDNLYLDGILSKC